MLEYVFFDSEPCDRFRAFLQQKGLASQVEQRELEKIVRVDEGAVDDALADELDDFYDEMFLLDQTLFEETAEPSSEERQAAGVVVNLADGRTVYAEVPSDLLSKVMAALTPAELGDFVNAVVDAVERPDERTLCQRVRS